MFLKRMGQRWAGVLLAGFSLAAGATYQDPLESTAEISPLAAASRLTAISAHGDRLMAAGPRGHLLLSRDGGAHWQQMSVPVRSDLVAIHFPSAEQGWAVGHDGIVLHSADGGRSWQKQLDSMRTTRLVQEHYRRRFAEGDVEALKFRNEIDRFCADPADKSFLDVRFFDNEEGFAVGAFNLALHTRDGGKSWLPLNERTDNPKSYHLYALSVAGGQVYLAGERGLLRRWNTRGQRFDAVPSPYGGSFFGLLAVGNALIAYGMRGNAFLTRDGGKTWKKLPTRSTDGITGGTVTEDGVIVLATQGGQLLVSNDDGATFGHAPTKNRLPYFGVVSVGRGRVAVVSPLGVSVEALR